MHQNKYYAGFTIISFPTKINLELTIKRFDLQENLQVKELQISARVATFKLYTCKSQSSRTLNEVFLDHIGHLRVDYII